MGIVIKQSIKNTIITYIGFGIGAVNVMYMYPVFLGKEYLLTGEINLFFILLSLKFNSEMCS